jgi:hypothetical protein
MTCIVGLEHAGKVYIGGDAAGTGGTHQVIMSEPKVFKRGPFVIGYTSSFRMGQLLQHTLKVPRWTESDNKTSVQSFMVRKFIPAVRVCLAEGGFLKKSEEVIRGGTFLVGYRGELHAVESDLQVGRVADGYYAVGCGMELALGSMHTTSTSLDPFEQDPRHRITLALEAAEHFSSGVAGPFTIVATR